MFRIRRWFRIYDLLPKILGAKKWPYPPLPFFCPYYPPGTSKKFFFQIFFKRYIIRFRILCWSQISGWKPKKIEHWPKKDWIYVQVAYSHLIGLTSFGRPMCGLETQKSTWVYSKTSKLSEYQILNVPHAYLMERQRHQFSREKRCKRFLESQNP